MEGEHLDTLERMVVSPAAGVFHPQATPAAQIDAGTTIGWIHTGGEAVPVVSPFTGRLMDLVAVAGERLTRYQHVAWLRSA